MEPGGNVSCPYRDRAVANAGGTRVLMERYATRRVVYLSGEFDRVDQDDQCETVVFQGTNRFERSERFFMALEFIFGKPVHERHVVPESPHDHMLMFQSYQGRKAVFGEGTNGLLLPSSVSRV